MSAPVAPAPISGRRAVASLLSSLGPLLGLIFVWTLFALLAGGDFVSWGAQRIILIQTVVVGTAAVGATVIIIAGGIDLSVGSSIALGTVVVARLLNASWSPLAAALGGIAVAMLCGAAIGTMVIGRIGRVFAVVLGLVAGLYTWSAVGPIAGLAAGAVAFAVTLALGERVVGRIPIAPFIVTLGTWGILRGGAKGLAENQAVYPNEPSWLYDLMGGASSGFGVVPPGVWVLFALALLMAGVLRYTRFGRHVFAIGSSEETARLCGVPIERVKILIYTIGVGCAGLSALFQFAYLNMGDPVTAPGYELKVIAAVVIGGASLSGGEGSIRGTIIGALILSVVDNGCASLGLDNWVQEILTGVIIVVAVAVDRYRRGAST